MLDERTEIKGVDDLDDAVEQHRAEHQSRPQPELAADKTEAEGERRAHDDAHERLDRQAERTERQRRARAFALSAAEGKDAERNE